MTRSLTGSLTFALTARSLPLPSLTAGSLAFATRSPLTALALTALAGASKGSLSVSAIAGQDIDSSLDS